MIPLINPFERVKSHETTCRASTMAPSTRGLSTIQEILEKPYIYGDNLLNPFHTHGATKCNRDIPIYLSTTHVALCTVHHTNEKFTNTKSNLVGNNMINQFRYMEHNRRLSTNDVPSSWFNGPNISNSDVRNKNIQTLFETKRTIF